MKDFGTLTGRKDPFLHFYEDFLAYNPASARAGRLVYPEPWSTSSSARWTKCCAEFGLADGLADIEGHNRPRHRTQRRQGKTDHPSAMSPGPILDPPPAPAPFWPRSSNEAPKSKTWPSVVCTSSDRSRLRLQLLMASMHVPLKLDMIGHGLPRPGKTPPPVSLSDQQP